MNFRKGERVRHPAAEEWGLGEVLADSNGESVRVFFVGAGEKLLSLKHAQPVRVAPEAAAHPVLDNLKISRSASGIRYQSLPESIQFFLERFPQGFYGKRFTTEEREYKDRAHALAVELLGKEAFDELLERADHPEIARRALKVVNATNLIFPNEKMALKDGLVGAADQESFARALHGLLFGEEPLQGRFEAFARVLESIGAAKWTIASYFPFIMRPDQFMFVKPTITQYAAELCGFEISYKPELNWLTFKRVLGFSDYLFGATVELEPRDMIDIQSFMWCVAPGNS